MSESFDFNGEIEPDSAFDRVEERTVPIERFPIHYDDGTTFWITPANAAIRMFFGATQVYSRLVVYPGDGTSAPLKLDDVSLCGMVRGGFPVELPDKPDETDFEFMEEFIQAEINEAL